MNFAVQVLVNAFITGTQVALIAVPLFMIYAVSRVYHFGVGAMAVGSAYILYAVLMATGSWYLAILSGLVTALMFAILSHLLLDGYIKKKQYLLAFLVSFSLGVLIESLISMAFGTEGKYLLEGTLDTLSWGDVMITVPGTITIIAGLCAAVFIGFLLHSTSFGRLLRGTSEHPSLVQSFGISTTPIRIAAYVISIILAGFVVVMIGANESLTPLMGNELNILGFVAFLLGGMRHVWGTIIAAYVITIVPQLIMAYSDLGVSWRLVIIFCIAVVMLMIFPKGITASHNRKS